MNPFPIVMRVLRSVAIAASCAIAGAGSSAALAASLQKGEMIVYRAGEKVPESELFDLGPPSGLGGIVLEGDPRISARIDYAEGNLLAGVFQATRGKVLIHFPFTEHATILVGEVELTDGGQQRAPRRGTATSSRRAATSSGRARTAFRKLLQPTTASDTPAPMIVYKIRDEVAQSELMDWVRPMPRGRWCPAIPGSRRRIDSATEGPPPVCSRRPAAMCGFSFRSPSMRPSSRALVTLTDENGRTARLRPGTAI